jgi:hypothetical protein
MGAVSDRTLLTSEPQSLAFTCCTPFASDLESYRLSQDCLRSDLSQKCLTASSLLVKLSAFLADPAQVVLDLHRNLGTLYSSSLWIGSHAEY